MGYQLMQLISAWAIPLVILGVLGAGMARRVRVYEAFVDGAKEGFQTGVRIIPFLVAMFVGVALFRESGAMSWLLAAISPLTTALGIPPEVVPLGFLRTLSGSASQGYLSSLLQTAGPDSWIGMAASTIHGSTETTFYVLTVYFGSVGVRNLRYAPAVGLLADLAGLLSAVYITKALMG